jgi:hypothetical protein
MLGDAADDAAAPPTLQASGGAPPPLAGAKKSLGDPGGPSKSEHRRPFVDAGDNVQQTFAARKLLAVVINTSLSAISFTRSNFDVIKENGWD